MINNPQKNAAQKSLADFILGWFLSCWPEGWRTLVWRGFLNPM